MNPAPPQLTVFHQWTGVCPCDREPLSLPLLPGRGDGARRLPPPYPSKTRISWMWPGSGLSSRSLLPCRPRGGVSRRQAGLQVLGLGRGVLSSWCSKQGGAPPPPSCAKPEPASCHPCQHPGRGKGQVMEEVEKRKEHLECGCRGNREITD